MAVSLFPHNRTAYENVCAMLEKTGKAAVIHPTGTGKSFIGFQYAADHPETKVLWLAPSEYIFKTQLENWKSAGGEELKNVTFLTYAKLSLMTEEELTCVCGDCPPETQGTVFCVPRQNTENLSAAAPCRAQPSEARLLARSCSFDTFLQTEAPDLSIWRKIGAACIVPFKSC